MALMQVTFDPDDVMYASDIAREVGVRVFSVHRYLARHPELPQPIFRLAMPGGQSMDIWTRPDFVELVDQYIAARNARRN